MSLDPYDHDLERGLRNRRAILGDAWVDKSIDNAHVFNAEFQAFITRYAWHEVWGRPGLDPRTRRIIVLAITTALGRWEEFELHTRAALTGGDPATRLSVDEVKEVLMQAAIYAGVPAANTAVALTTRILRDAGYELGPFPAQNASHPGTGRSALTPRAEGRPAIHHTVREPRHGAAPRATVVLSHALGCDVMMWDALANALARDCRVIAFDHRGHGGSDAPAGPYTMAELADDAAAVIDAASPGEPVVFVGLSMGGMVAQELALRHPAKVRALVLANTSAGYPSEAREGWAQRIAAIEAGGLEAIADGAMARWFTEAFRAANRATVARWRQRVVTQNASGYVAACHAIRDHHTLDRLAGITVPTLVIAGEHDLGTPVAMNQAIADGIPGARCLVLPDASHLSVLEQPAAFAAAVQGFLAGL
jgi:3-oxoadipate enol-lactonase